MPLVLTESSVVRCDHPPTGGGALELAGAGPLSVNGAKVLSGSIAPASIGSGCTQTPPSQTTTPCLVASSQDDGRSSVLKVDGVPVVVDTATGKTNGKPGSTWSVKDATQRVLKAE
jgi:hypothetical protein